MEEARALNAITFQSETAYLLDDAPADAAIELTAALPVFLEEGTTKREARTPLGDTLRLSLGYTAVLEGFAVARMRNSLQALITQRVLCPLWCAPFAAGDSPIGAASYYILLDGLTAPEIKAHADLPFARDAYPLLVGRLEDPPDPQLLNGNDATVTLKFIESDVWSYNPPEFAETDALDDASGATRPLFPFDPNWASRPRGGRAEVDLERKQIGEGRQTADQYFEQPSRRPAQQAFTLLDDEPWQLLRFFLDRAGVQQNFWLPAGVSDLQLVAGIAAADDALQVEDETTLGNNRYLLIRDSLQRVPVTVAAGDYLTDDLGNRLRTPEGELILIDGDPTDGRLQLLEAVGADFALDETRIESLMLARFSNPEIKIQFVHSEQATAKLTFAEVPWEAVAVAGETIGTTMGAMPASSYLYEFRSVFPDVTQYWRYTDFERDITYATHTWSAVPIEFDEIAESDTIERQETTIKSRRFAGNPLALLLPFQLEWPLQLDIYEYDGTTATRVFSGEILDADFEPPYITARAASLHSIYERQFPRQLLQPGDNWALFEDRNGLDRDDWEWAGTVNSFDGATFALALSAVARVSGAPVTLTANYFAGGYVVIGSGATAQYRLISSSAAAVGTTITLTVGMPFTTNPGASDAATFYPGYAGRWQEDAITKFANEDNFGGFPFMPIGNPTVARVDKKTSAGGKK